MFKPIDTLAPRKPPPWWLLLLHVLPLLLCAEEDPLQTEGWHHAEWDHITILSNAPAKETEAITSSIADFVESIGHVLPFPSRTDRWPLRIVVCRDAETFAALAPAESKYREHVSGLFTEGLGYDVILLLAGASRAELRSTLFHELVHREMRVNGDIPLWLDEGLAEVFSLFRIRGDQLQYGLSDAAYRHWIQRQGTLSLARLFQVHHGSPEYNTAPLSTSFYATCWAFTHYGLFGEDGALRDRFLAFVESARRGPISAATFAQHFAMSMDAMEERLGRYVRSFRFPKGQVNVPQRTRIKSLNWDTGDAAVHRILLAGARTLSRRFESARRMLDESDSSIETTTALKNAHRVERATLSFFEQDFEAAHNHARQAYTDGNRTPTTLLLNAQGLLQIQPGQRVHYDRVIPLQAVNLAFRNINAVLKIAPRNSLACRLYTLAWLRTNQEPSLAQYEKLMDHTRVLADDSEIAFLTADLMRYHQKPQLAREVLERFRSQTTLKWARDEAEQRLQQLP